MSEFLGRPLEPGEVVHHRNGNEKDNRIDNLELHTRASHAGVHATRPAIVVIVCAYCGKQVKKRANLVKTKQKQGQVDFYCNRSCMGKHFGAGRRKK